MAITAILISFGLNSRTETRAFAQEIVPAKVSSPENDAEDVQVSVLNESFTKLVDAWRLGKASLEGQPQSIRDLIAAVRPDLTAESGKHNDGLTFADLYRIRQVIDGAHLRAKWKKVADFETLVEKYQKAVSGHIPEELSARNDGPSNTGNSEESHVEFEPKLSLANTTMNAWRKGQLRIEDLPEVQREMLIEIGRGRIPVPNTKNDGVLMIHLEKLDDQLIQEQHRIELLRDLDTAIDRGTLDPRIFYFHSGLIMKADRTKAIRSLRTGIELESTAIAMRIIDGDRFLNETFPSVMTARGSPRSTLLLQEYEDVSRFGDKSLPSRIVTDFTSRTSEMIAAQEYLVSESLRLINNARTSSNGLVYMRKQLSAWRKPDKDLLKPELPDEKFAALSAVESALRIALLLPHEQRLSGIGTIKIRDVSTLSTDKDLLVTQLTWLMRLALVSRDNNGARIPFELTQTKEKGTGSLVDHPKIAALTQATD